MTNGIAISEGYCKLSELTGDLVEHDSSDAEANTHRMDQRVSPPPPVIMVNDRVLLHYAILNDSVGFNSGHRLTFVDGKEIGRVPCLAICRDRNSPQFMLYYCDSNWGAIGLASYDSVDAAKRIAERMYPGQCTILAQQIQSFAGHSR